MVAGEPLRRVGAPTPRLLRSPPLAKVQSHSHHLLRQVLFAYLADTQWMFLISFCGFQLFPGYGMVGSAAQEKKGINK